MAGRTAVERIDKGGDRMTSEKSAAMRPQDWFGVAIRTLGVWILVRALSYLLAIVGQQVAQSATIPRDYYVWGFADLGAGLFMLLGADLIVGIAYRSPAIPERDDDAQQQK
jgi:hypothetical protein